MKQVAVFYILGLMILNYYNTVFIYSFGIDLVNTELIKSVFA